MRSSKKADLVTAVALKLCAGSWLFLSGYCFCCETVRRKLAVSFSCSGSEDRVVTVHAVKTLGSRGIAPLLLNLDTRRRKSVRFTSWLLCSREKNPRAYRWVGRWTGPTAGVDCPCREWNPRLLFPARRLVTVPLRYPSSGESRCDVNLELAVSLLTEPAVTRWHKKQNPKNHCSVRRRTAS
jgi:hypothetical protein